jgi:LAS superfamily LD-carboxypeptidase LdcB
VRVIVVLCLLARLARAETVVGYRNGKALDLEVSDVDGVPVEVTTAHAFIVMRDAAAEAGVYLQAWSGFRTNEKQAELYQAWKDGVGNPAAKPGYSNHQSGRALDINLLGVPPETFAWLTKNAARFGFRRTVPSEPWHWEYTPPKRAAASRHARR